MPILLVVLAVLAGTSLAEARPDSLAMSCATTRALVNSQGAVVIGTGPNIYDRYVTDAGYCPTQRSEPAWLRTADQAQCLIGQRCRERRLRVQ